MKGEKNDSCDAEAFCDAVARLHMGFVPLKPVESQDIQAIHRLRSRLVKERIALVKQVRGLLAERGIFIAQGITKLRKQFPTIVEDMANVLTPFCSLFASPPVHAHRYKRELQYVPLSGPPWTGFSSPGSYFRPHLSARERRFETVAGARAEPRSLSQGRYLLNHAQLPLSYAPAAPCEAAANASGTQQGQAIEATVTRVDPGHGQLRVDH